MVIVRAWWPRNTCSLDHTTWPRFTNHHHHHHINTRNTSTSRSKIMMMEGEEKEDPKNNKKKKKEYLHYNHTDNLPTRWTSRECYEFMYASRRPWHKVVHFYSLFLNSTLSSPSLTLQTLIMPTTSFIHHHHHTDADDFIEEPESETHLTFQTTKTTGRWARANFKIVLSYHGPSFDGWQKQPALNTVQGVVEKSFGKFIDEKKFELLKHKGLPIEGCAVVAGRTDKGVTALQQVCSFYTWREDVKPQDIEEAINDAAPGKLRVISVSKVSRAFHPNFSAKWRRYLYIFPLNVSDEQISQSEDIEDVDYNFNYGGHKNEYDDSYIDAEDSNLLHDNNNVETGASKKPTSFSVNKVNQLLHQLEGKLLSYRIFARDTKASRSIGPPTECFVFHARAAETTLPSDAEDAGVTKVMCIELVANRFLRKMVRVLVATSIREAAAGADDDALIKLMDATCRRATAPPAPPDGLCLVDVGYSEFNPKICLIQ